MNTAKMLAVLLLLVAVLGAASNSEAASTKVYLEGRLLTAAGAPPADGLYPITFNVYRTETGGAPLWFDTIAEVKLTSGRFAVTLGSKKAFTWEVLWPDKPAAPARVSVFSAEARWLEVVVGAEVYGPRVRIDTSAYAANADRLDGLDSANFSRSTHNHSLAKLTGVLLDTQVPATITRDTELTAGLATKADTAHTHDDRYYTKAEVDGLKAEIATLKTAVGQLTTLLQNVSRSGNDLYFTGVNVHVRNGLNNTETKNGYGNLIVGYNEPRNDGADDRSGSHYIVAGTSNNYSSYGGLVAGYWNTASGVYASVSGGSANTASGAAASVSGGYYSSASGNYASVSGGAENTASGNHANVSGGFENTASGPYASVSGGAKNTASGNHASVSGGFYNTASYWYASVSGGAVNTASDYYASVSGGSYNKASGYTASINGGVENVASGGWSSVSGGRENTASEDSATVSGGKSLVADTYCDWAAPGH